MATPTTPITPITPTTPTTRRPITPTTRFTTLPTEAITTIKSGTIIKVCDKDEKIFLTGTPAEIVQALAKTNYLSARVEDSPNVYMYVIKVNMLELFGIKVRVQYGNFAHFVRQMLHLGLLKLLEIVCQTTTNKE